MASIEFVDFTFQYRAQSEPTLRDINLRIESGQRVAIVGQSGSGKSTLANAINGLIPHRYPGTWSGSVRVGDLDPLRVPLVETSKMVGTVLQDTDGQFIGLTVAEDVAFALENAEVDRETMVDTVRRATDLVGISERLHASPLDLSGGQKQRVSMAGVLVDQVQVLLFDEPLASLDPASGRATMEVINDIHAARGATVLIIEHRLEDVLHGPNGSLGVDRIVVMDAGRIVADGTPDEVVASGVLLDHGIREPLFLTAVRLADPEGSQSRPAPADSSTDPTATAATNPADTPPTDPTTTAATADAGASSHAWSPTAAAQPARLQTLRIPANRRAALAAWADCPTPPPAAGEELLRLDDLHFAINDTAIINGVTASIDAGEVISLCGTNGAGKSTLAKLICGFETPDSGRIYLAGQDITRAPIARRGRDIGFVLQNPNQMISQPMIIEEVSLALRGADLSDSERDQRIEQVLRLCGLWAYRSWPVSALSYGQRKRVTIASVMVTRPRILILDEPTAGQDWAHYTEIMEFLRDLGQLGTTIILVTHDMHLALEYTQRCLVMSDGKLIADASPAQILADEDVCQQASLRTTSLAHLARQVGASDAAAFIEQFIARERPWRERVLASHLGRGR
ncbi:MAG: energy-coupling factor transporter ATPase [Actinomycetaceae bacterium]|nr:energy-coupling factor transporter ATPase [Actinomycetaceae bacterium]